MSDPTQVRTLNDLPPAQRPEQPQKLVYTGLGVTRRYNPQLDMVPCPDLFTTPPNKWVVAELWWRAGFDVLIFESVGAARATAAAMKLEFVCRVKEKP